MADGSRGGVSVAGGVVLSVGRISHEETPCAQRGG